MQILFMGTPAFAVPSLNALLKSGDTVVAVFTQPDKPVGRKAVLTPPPVKEQAKRYGIPVYQPETLRDGAALAKIISHQPDLIVVTAYGKILPKEILYAPRYGAINIHASLLPKLRGAAPIQRSIINGDTLTGVTAQQMNEGIDTGDILLSWKLDINENETAGELTERMSYFGGTVLSETIRQLKYGLLRRVKQNDDLATYAPMLTKAMSPIDWTKSAQEVHNLVRGLNPWPMATMQLGGKTVKVHHTFVYGTVTGDPGQIIVGNHSITVVCGDGRGLRILELQPVNGKTMAAAEYLRGHTIY